MSFLASWKTYKKAQKELYSMSRFCPATRFLANPWRMKPVFACWWHRSILTCTRFGPRTYIQSYSKCIEGRSHVHVNSFADGRMTRCYVYDTKFSYVSLFLSFFRCWLSVRDLSSDWISQTTRALTKYCDLKKLWLAFNADQTLCGTYVLLFNAYDIITTEYVE